MRENSGSGKNQSDSRDPTLKDNAGTRPSSEPAHQVKGVATDFEVAADHDPEGGKRSPSARGRGEAGPDENAPNIS